jgi:purine nucleoside phosphorylase
MLSSLGASKKSARSRKPSKKGMVGIVAGAGLGAAAMAKRSRTGSENEPPTTPPVQPVQATGAQDSTPAA